MIRATILAALIAGPAAAQSPRDRMTLAPGSGACWAVVLIENRAGTYNATETLATARGPVSIRYQTVGGHKPGDDDRITVQSPPDGVAAAPMEMAIPDGDTGTVCLMEYLGG